MILADIKLEAGTGTVLQLPANFNTFLYVLKGGIVVGDNETVLNADQAGWLDIFNSDASSELKLKGREQGVSLVLYAGKPTGNAIVSHGPFIGGSNEDIVRLYNEYRQGKMKHISAVDEEQRVVF
jgi:hypothetical protein